MRCSRYALILGVTALLTGVSSAAPAPPGTEVPVDIVEDFVPLP
jgi:hypothetical protein